MKFRKYITMTRAGVIESLNFRLGIAVTILGNLIYLVIIYYLWKAIFASVDVDVVNGMTFQDTMIYLVLAAALFSFMEMYFVWNMGQNIQSGKIILDLIKPMKYRRYIFFHHTGYLIMSFLTTFLPTAVVIYFVTDGGIHLGINIVFFCISVVFAELINYYIDFFVATICLYVESSWGLNIMKEVIISVLSGASIPLAFFPETLGKIVMYLPFQAIYNIPLSILIKSDINNIGFWQMIGTQLFWVLFMAGISDWFWNISIRRITVNGG